MAPVFAHFGHWYVSLIYAAPVLLTVVWVLIAGWRDRRRGDDEDDLQPPATP